MRFDTALYQGYRIPPYYDSMIGKLIVFAATRAEAMRKMQAALCEMVIEGVEHTGSLQSDLINEKGVHRRHVYHIVYRKPEAAKVTQMLPKNLFRRPRNTLEDAGQSVMAESFACTNCKLCRTTS